MNAATEKHISYLWSRCAVDSCEVDKWEHIKSGLLFMFNCTSGETFEDLALRDELLMLAFIAGDYRKEAERKKAEKGGQA